MADRDNAGHFAPGHNLPGPGRPSLYDDAMAEQARKLALLGLTEEEMASFFGVTRQTLDNWCREYPAFFAAVQDGRTIADANVADSLYKRATGEHVQIEKVFTNRKTGEHEVVKVLAFVPGESGAAMNWLKNRRRQNWQDKVDLAHSGSVAVERPDFADLTEDEREVIRRIAQRRAAKPAADAD